MDSQLTGLIKNYGFRLGSDLVGVANIERFANAPIQMSPQGIFPEAKSVIVCAVHHPDGCVEMGGREHPQVVGPYGVQYYMNTHLDHISYEMARYVEDLGYDAIPIACSNIWRYRNYKDLGAVFAPDMSHIYAALTAGLSELGYHGISMSPEFGPRNRFISIITDAVLDPSPLLPGDSLCDNCRQCAKHCLSGALTEELDGFDELVVEDRTYRKVHKNLWRCSWGEHFGVDLDLPKPEHVTEAGIIQTIREEGLRGGEMGSCLRHCLPPQLRMWDREYTTAPRRKQHYLPNTDTMPRYVQEEMSAAAIALGMDFVLVHDQAGLEALSIDCQDRLPDAISAATFGVFVPATATGGETHSAADYFAFRACYLAARKIENLGYSVVVSTDLHPDVMKPAVAGLAPEGWRTMTATFFTSAPLVASTPTQQHPVRPHPRNLTRALKAMAPQWQLDQIGVASPERIAELRKQLAPVMEGEKILLAVNKGKMWLEFEPEVTEGERKLRDASDYLEGAKAVVVMGLRLPEATVRLVGQPPAEAVGPYVFAQYITQWILREKALLLVKWLREFGYKAEVSLDLMNTGSMVSSPRGPQHNVYSNRFEAVAAGLGAITKGGFVTTQEFGTNVRYVAVITDAPLEADALQRFESILGACEDCSKCMEACPPQAYLEEITLQLENQPIRYHRLDQKRCDWCARYGLMGGDGFANMGVDTNIVPPAEITIEALGDGLRTLDTVQSHHRCGVESCVVKCPLSSG